MKHLSRIFEFFEEYCHKCKYGEDGNVCHGNSEACGKCANGRYENNRCLDVYEYFCACCDQATDEEVEQGRCKYFVEKDRVDGSEVT